MRRIQRTPTKDEKAQILQWIADNPRMRLAEINKKLEATESDLLLCYKRLEKLRILAKKKYTAELEAYEHEAVKEGLAQRVSRLYEKQERHALLKRIIEERGAHDSMQNVPGGTTGLIVKDYKQMFEVFKIDAALLKELRELEKEIAIELGQWTEKRELSGPEGGPIPIAVSDMLDKIYGGKDEQAEKQSDPDSQ